VCSIVAKKELSLFSKREADTDKYILLHTLSYCCRDIPQGKGYISREAKDGCAEFDSSLARNGNNDNFSSDQYNVSGYLVGGKSVMQHTYNSHNTNLFAATDETKRRLLGL
jgi:hypothetical protein